MLLIIKQHFIFNFDILFNLICNCRNHGPVAGTSPYLCPMQVDLSLRDYYPGEESPDNAGQHTT
jgi:hypothetical protein